MGAESKYRRVVRKGVSTVYVKDLVERMVSEETSEECCEYCSHTSRTSEISYDSFLDVSFCEYCLVTHIDKHFDDVVDYYLQRVL